MSDAVEGLLRACAPQALGALVRRYGRFDACEDAVQEALIEAARRWPDTGVPDEPVAWVITTAGHKYLDAVRSDTARRRREEAVAAEPAPATAPSVDDTLDMLLLCAHPDLTGPSRIALTLRAVGGLTTAEIARAFLVPEPTMAQRISRARATVAAAGLTRADRDQRLPAVRHVLYLVFTEGHTASSGGSLTRVDLSAEAIRLTRLLHDLRPDDAETAGLLALLLLTDARRAARTGPGGRLVPLADQDRSRWDPVAIAEAVALLERTLPGAPSGRYLLEASIAAVHAEAPDDAGTDWRQIAILYRVLENLTGNPVVTVNRAVAVGMAHGPRAGLVVLDGVAGDPRLARHHRPDAVRAHLLERLGDTAGAREHYLRAARAALNPAEKRHLEERAARRSGPGAPP